MAVAQDDFVILTGSPAGLAGGGGSGASSFSIAIVVSAADGNGNIVVAPLDGGSAKTVKAASVYKKLVPVAP
jgi:hypothetical protein